MLLAKCTMVWLKKKHVYYFIQNVRPPSFSGQPALLSAEPRKPWLNIQKYDHIYRYITGHVRSNLIALAFCIRATNHLKEALY
jgi:hypothetical protein